MGLLRGRRAARGALVALGALATGVVAGCGAQADEPEPTSELDAYLDEIYGTVDEATRIADHDAVQEFVAACMADLGFEYQPTTAPPEYVLPEFTPETAAEFGYAEITEVWGPDVAPPRFAGMPGDDPAVDFNTSYAYGLAPEAQEQYWLALYGPDLPAAETADLPVEERGCYDQAYAQVFPEWEQNPPEFEAVQRAIREEMWWVDEDPRLVALHPAWADCMADAGYPGMVDVMDAAALVGDRLNASSLSLAKPWAQLKEMFPEEIAELRQLEIDVATADAGCRTRVGWFDLRDEILATAEQNILERYRPELEAMVAWVREHRG